MSNGYSFAAIKALPSNMHVFLFDKTGKYIFFYYTNKGATLIYDIDNAKKRRSLENIIPTLMELCVKSSKLLNIYDDGVCDFNALGIFGTLGEPKTDDPNIIQGDDGTFRYAEGQDVKPKEFTFNPSVKGAVMSLWIKGKLAARFYATENTSKGAYGRGAGNVTTSVTADIFDRKATYANINEIYHKGFKQLSSAYASSDSVMQLGIYHSTFVKNKKIADFGKVSAYRGDDVIGLFDDEGMFAYTHIKEHARTHKITILHSSICRKIGVSRDRLDKIFQKIVDYMNTKTADKTPPTDVSFEPTTDGDDDNYDAPDDPVDDFNEE
jgi:hypothetical protein